LFLNYGIFSALQYNFGGAVVKYLNKAGQSQPSIFFDSHRYQLPPYSSLNNNISA